MSDRRSRDSRIVRLLENRAPVSVTEVNWGRPLRISTHLGTTDLPEDLVVSVRCVVRVDDLVVVCTNADGRTHAWPGGRREPGESYIATASREVWEETGWHIDPSTLETLGFLHLFNRGAPLDPYPHPDTLQVVTTAQASRRETDDWTDLEGYEVSSRLLPLGDALETISPEEPICIPYLHHLARRHP